MSIVFLVAKAVCFALLHSVVSVATAAPTIIWFALTAFIETIIAAVIVGFVSALIGIKTTLFVFAYIGLAMSMCISISNTVKTEKGRALDEEIALMAMFSFGWLQALIVHFRSQSAVHE